MAGRRILPDVPTLLRHVAKGLSHEDISNLYGTSRQAVSTKLRGAVEPRATHRREWPWDVEPRHKKGWLYSAITAYTVARTKERPLSTREQQQLARFMDMLERLPGDFVIDYFPGTPLGFGLRERAPARDDPDSLIGVPESAAA